MRNNGPFGRLVSDFGGAEEDNKEEGNAVEEEAVETFGKTSITKQDIVRLTKKHMGKAAGTGKLEVRSIVGPSALLSS
jgi:ATP-binding cassette subfamily C (CFTR/MRP) protein 1